MTECKFKVGDRVKYTGKNSSYHEKALINKLGTVKKVHPDINFCVVVDWDDKNSKILDVVSISMGAIIYEPNSYISANKLYKQADECLYKSKENARNQYLIYKGKE